MDIETLKTLLDENGLGVGNPNVFISKVYSGELTSAIERMAEIKRDLDKKVDIKPFAISCDKNIQKILSIISSSKNFQVGSALDDVLLDFASLFEPIRSAVEAEKKSEEIEKQFTEFSNSEKDFVESLNAEALSADEIMIKCIEFGNEKRKRRDQLQKAVEEVSIKKRAMESFIANINLDQFGNSFLKKLDELNSLAEAEVYAGLNAEERQDVLDTIEDMRSTVEKSFGSNAQLNQEYQNLCEEYGLEEKSAKREVLEETVLPEETISEEKTQSQTPSGFEIPNPVDSANSLDDKAPEHKPSEEDPSIDLPNMVPGETVDSSFEVKPQASINPADILPDIDVPSPVEFTIPHPDLDPAVTFDGGAPEPNPNASFDLPDMAPEETVDSLGDSMPGGGENLEDPDTLDPEALFGEFLGQNPTEAEPPKRKTSTAHGGKHKVTKVRMANMSKYAIWALVGFGIVTISTSMPYLATAVIGGGLGVGVTGLVDFTSKVLKEKFSKPGEHEYNDPAKTPSERVGLMKKLFPNLMDRYKKSKNQNVESTVHQLGAAPLYKILGEERNSKTR